MKVTQNKNKIIYFTRDVNATPIGFPGIISNYLSQLFL